MAAASSMGGRAGRAGKKKEPNSPRLLPAGSPGPITPLELEMDGDEGYIVAGGRARGTGLIGGGLGQEREMMGRGAAAGDQPGRESPAASV